MMAIVGGALLAIGFILLATGVNIPLGLGLIVLGAASIAAAVAVAWDLIPDEMRNTIAIITAIVGVAFLVLGAILLFSGVNIPLGLALIALGALALASTVTAMWSSLTPEVQGAIFAIFAIVSVALLVIGCVLLFSGAAMPLGLALVALGAAGLAAVAALSWGKLTPEIRETIAGIMAIVGGALVAIGVILLCFGVIPLGLGLIVAGAAAIFAATFMTEDIVSAVKKVLDKIAKKFSDFWDKIKGGFKSFLNWIIDRLNDVIDGINALITPIRGVIWGVMKLAGKEVSMDDISIPHIPRLATGAVLPGGKPFAAIVGDQPAGQTNIEAPLDTIKEALIEVLANYNPNFKIEATGSMAQLIRLLNLELKKDDKRLTVWR